MFCGIRQRAISQDMHTALIHNTCLGITLSKLQSYLPKADVYHIVPQANGIFDIEWWAKWLITCLYIYICMRFWVKIDKIAISNRGQQVKLYSLDWWCVSTSETFVLPTGHGINQILDFVNKELLFCRTGAWSFYNKSPYLALISIYIIICVAFKYGRIYCR